jgi:hypothetical protein
MIVTRLTVVNDAIETESVTVAGIAIEIESEKIAA